RAPVIPMLIDLPSCCRIHPAGKRLALPIVPSRHSQPLSLTGRWRVGYRLPVMAQAPRVFNPDKQIDCTGLFCPMPIVKTREAIKQMVPGQVLEMLSDDPASEADMKSWAQITGNDLLSIDRAAAVFRFLVRKAG